MLDEHIVNTIWRRPEEDPLHRHDSQEDCHCHIGLLTQWMVRSRGGRDWLRKVLVFSGILVAYEFDFLYMYFVNASKISSASTISKSFWSQESSAVDISASHWPYLVYLVVECAILRVSTRTGANEYRSMATNCRTLLPHISDTSPSDREIDFLNVSISSRIIFLEFFIYLGNKVHELQLWTAVEEGERRLQYDRELIWRNSQRMNYVIRHEILFSLPNFFRLSSSKPTCSKQTKSHSNRVINSKNHRYINNSESTILLH